MSRFYASSLGVRLSGASGVVAIGLLVSGCLPAYPESEYPRSPPAHVAPEPRPIEPPPPGVIWRQDLEAAIDTGLGRLLQLVELEPEMEYGEFLGFRVVSLRPPDFWQGVDLRPGDIVQRVNGLPIERATEAHEAFESLREASHLNVTYLRAGQPRTLSYELRVQPNP